MSVYDQHCTAVGGAHLSLLATQQCSFQREKGLEVSQVAREMQIFCKKIK